MDESISGSESSGSDEDEDATTGKGEAREDILTALLKKQAKISNATGSSDEVVQEDNKSGLRRQPVLWFTTPALLSNTSLGVYRALFTDLELGNQSSIPESLRRKQLSSMSTQITANSGPLTGPTDHPPHYFLCMIGGGHFAAMIVSLAPKFSKRSTGPQESQANVLAHKTFHRYTTRRKQGGAQSSSDASKGAAHSAGSSLRRHNEAALINEIRLLLGEWRSMIDSAQLLFVRASGTTNRRALYGPYEGQVLRSNDVRVRGFPFNTRRATQAELMRAFGELTRVKVSQVDEVALAAAAAASNERAAKLKQQTQPDKASNRSSASKVSEEEASATLYTSQLQSLIRRSKAAGVSSYIANHSISSTFRFHPPDTQQNYHAPTPLHLAASINSASVVLSLLAKAQSDPTILNGEGKTAYDLSGDRATRDAFRVGRHILGETRWDWAAARVPGPLSKEKAEQRVAQDRAERQRDEDLRRQVEMERLRLAEEQDESAGQRGHAREAAAAAGGKGRGRSLGIGVVAAAVVGRTPQERREEEMRGLGPEARMRLERERRARAAEERIRALQNRGAGSG